MRKRNEEIGIASEGKAKFKQCEKASEARGREKSMARSATNEYDDFCGKVLPKRKFRDATFNFTVRTSYNNQIYFVVLSETIKRIKNAVCFANSKSSKEGISCIPNEP